MCVCTILCSMTCFPPDLLWWAAQLTTLLNFSQTILYWEAPPPRPHGSSWGAPPPRPPDSSWGASPPRHPVPPVLKNAAFFYSLKYSLEI